MTWAEKHIDMTLLAVLIVAHLDRSLALSFYHPPAHAGEVEDRLFWRIFNIMSDIIVDGRIIVINPTHRQVPL